MATLLGLTWSDTVGAGVEPGDVVALEEAD